MLVQGIDLHVCACACCRGGLCSLQLMTQARLSSASDVYSFGIIMYEMLTWQMPFHDLSKEQVRSTEHTEA
jgi:serine/threonine protein kinase